MPLYARVMGEAWTRVAGPVRLAHGSPTVTRAHGRLRVERGRHFAARIFALALRLPRQSPAADTTLIVTPHAGGELWQRTIDGSRFDTRQYQSPASELAERFGILEFLFQLEESGGGLRFVQREAALTFGPARFRVPRSCAPRVEAREDPEGTSRVRVGVRVALPLIGLLIAYDGTIEIEDSRS